MLQRQVKCGLPQGQGPRRIAQPLDIEDRQHPAEPVLINDHVRGRHAQSSNDSMPYGSPDKKVLAAFTEKTGRPRSTTTAPTSSRPAPNRAQTTKKSASAPCVVKILPPFTVTWSPLDPRRGLQPGDARPRTLLCHRYRGQHFAGQARLQVPGLDVGVAKVGQLLDCAEVQGLDGVTCDRVYPRYRFRLPALRQAGCRPARRRSPGG